jgi:hypothetical protein
VADPLTGSDAGLISFQAHGVTMWVATNTPEARERLPSVLPPGWQLSEESEVDYRFAVMGDERGTYAVDVSGEVLIRGASLDLALETLDDVMQSSIARDAPNRMFVHAGVVAYGGRTLVLPGKSFSGKTTLVAALVRAGAIYYSDEYAPIDEDGLVHPYAKPLSLRDNAQLQRDLPVQSLGGIAGEVPLPIGAVVATIYRPGAEWRPNPLSAGAGALALLSHTVPTRERPGQALRTVIRAIDGAIFLGGDRGEADAMVPLLLAEIAAQTA